MKMKKIVSMALALVLVLSIGMTSVHANGWGNGKIPPGQAKKYFNDTDMYKWAEQAIEKLYSKGFVNGKGDNKFAPQASVTKIEALTMALRVMGWEDEVKDVKDLPKKYKGEKIADWAIGYVTLAYEKGILDDIDMMYFKANDPAARHEVAKYVIRALGYEKEAQKNMNKDLPFADSLAIPQGSVGYVYLINDFELMTGDNQKRFNPMGTMTRAEMAVLFSRLDSKVDTGKDEVVSGELSKIYSDRIAVKVKDKVKNYDLDSRVIVYQDNVRIDIDYIKIGSKIKMEIKNDKVVFIEVVDTFEEDKIISRYSGNVKEINKTKPYKLAIQSETMIVMFEVIDDVTVSFKDSKGKFEDIKKDDKVSLVVDRKNRVTKIDVERKYEKPIENIKGNITDLNLARRYSTISINNKEYELDANVEVKIDGKSKDLDDLVVGMYAEIEIEDGVVVYIEAEIEEKTIYGEIRDITKSSKGITLKIEDEKTDKTVTYLVDKNAKLYIEDVRNPELDDLRKGDEGEFEILNGVIVEIYIED